MDSSTRSHTDTDTDSDTDSDTDTDDDDDSAIDVRASNVQGKEGDEIVVSFSTGAAKIEEGEEQPNVTVYYRMVPITAGLLDYSASSPIGSFTVVAGKSWSVPIQLLKDFIEEESETFRVEITNAVYDNGATVVTTNGIVTIENVRPQIKVDGPIGMGREGDWFQATFTSTGAQGVVYGPNETVTVFWETVSGTAIADRDFKQASGSFPMVANLSIAVGN